MLLAALLTPACRTQTPQRTKAEGEPFYFVQITDTHLGAAGNDRSVTQIVEMINSLPMPVAFVAHTGDLSADQLDKPEATSPGLSALKQLKAPVHFVPGNHDITASRPAETLAAWTNLVGPLSHSMEYRGVVLVFAYTEPLLRQPPVPGYDPLAWLENELRLAGTRPVILFHHTPPMDDFYRGQWHAGWPEEARRKWLALTRSANVVAVITGHFHRDELQWMGDLPVYVAPPVARFWGRQPSFRVYEYRNGRIGYRSCYVEEPRRAAGP